ncbi:MAG: hypothetical protein WCK78_19675 [Paludibacter sp.]
MKKIYLTVFYLLSLYLNAQQIPTNLLSDFVDYGTCSNSTNSSSQQVIYSGNCLQVADYGKLLGTKFKPSTSQSIIFIRLNLIFLQRADGTGNFQENNSEQMSLIDDAIIDMNRIYANLANPNDMACYSGTDFISDTRIQFIANKIFVKDNYGWNNCHDHNGTKCPSSPWYLDYLDNQIVLNSNILRGINVYFTEDSIKYKHYVEIKDSAFKGAGYACSQFPSTINYSGSSKIHMPDKYTKYLHMINDVPIEFNQPWIPNIRYWELNGIAVQLAHEIGHSLSLFHPDDPAVYLLFYPSTYCYSSLMNMAWGPPHNYLPPTEIGRMHAALSYSNLRTFVPTDAYTGVKDISTTETWNNT